MPVKNDPFIHSPIPHIPHSAPVANAGVKGPTTNKKVSNEMGEVDPKETSHQKAISKDPTLSYFGSRLNGSCSVAARTARTTLAFRFKLKQGTRERTPQAKCLLSAEEKATLVAKEESTPYHSPSVSTDPPIVHQTPDRLTTIMHYASYPKDGPGSTRLHQKRRTYLAACDFSAYSYNALAWVVGTLMRDGDALHVVTVVTPQPPETTRASTEDTLAEQLQKASSLLVNTSKEILSLMSLVDIQLVTYAIAGRVKDVLGQLIKDLPLTMVVCGSRGKSPMKR
ncbi:hypothetical protein BDF14DRAFT_1884500 [Spinellus fusiger]|nr:hypothetical protein BDF14DRAFT_1884500 [Spinellus fusiger]